MDKWKELIEYCQDRIEASKADLSGSNEEHNAEESAFESVLEWIHENVED